MAESDEYQHMEAFEPEGDEVGDFDSIRCQLCFEEVANTEFLKHVCDEHSSEIKPGWPGGIIGLLIRLDISLETEIEGARGHPEVQFQLVEDQSAIWSIMIQRLRQIGNLN